MSHNLAIINQVDPNVATWMANSYVDVSIN